MTKEKGEDYVEVYFSNVDKFNTFLLNKTWKTTLKGKKVVINSNYEILCFPKLGGFIVSERLKCAIQNNGFTGLRFELVEYFESNFKIS